MSAEIVLAEIVLAVLATAGGCAVLAWAWYRIGYMDAERDQRRAEDAGRAAAHQVGVDGEERDVGLSASSPSSELIDSARQLAAKVRPSYSRHFHAWREAHYIDLDDMSADDARAVISWLTDDPPPREATS